MNITLDAYDVNDFITNSKDKVFKNIMQMKVSTNIHNNILNTILYILPIDIIKIVHEYTLEKYIVAYTFASSLTASTSDYKLISFSPRDIIYNEIRRSINMHIDYIYYFSNAHFYSITYDKGHNANITLINEKYDENVYNMTLNNNDMEYYDIISKELITIIVFVVNSLLKILVKEGKNIL